MQGASTEHEDSAQKWPWEFRAPNKEKPPRTQGINTERAQKKGNQHRIKGIGAVSSRDHFCAESLFSKPFLHRHGHEDPPRERGPSDHKELHREGSFRGEEKSQKWHVRAQKGRSWEGWRTYL